MLRTCKGSPEGFEFLGLLDRLGELVLGLVNVVFVVVVLLVDLLEILVGIAIFFNDNHLVV